MTDATNDTSPAVPSPKPQPSRKQSKTKLKNNKSRVAIVLVLLLAIGSSVYFYNKYQDSQNKLKHPEIVAKAETKSLIERVGKHVELPNEEPTVATVSDVSKLSNQTFFAKAKNGDKVLVYSKAKQAILYRPSTDLVINMGPLNTNGVQQ